MKVCILSMQRVGNMGSLLQSYALKKTIEKQGHQVEFIDIEKKNEDYELIGDYKQEYYEEREATGFIGKFKKVDRYALNRLKIKKKSIEQGNVFEEFRKNELSIEKKSLIYDVCVIGSDEVFNCLNSGVWGFTSQLFGNISQADKVITYAASCGATTYEILPEKVKNKIRQSFHNISAFSVRDKNTHKFVSKLTDKDICDNLDPVLIYDFDKEVEDVELPQLPEHYCVVYSYYNRIHTSEEITAIKEFCRKRHLTPVAIGAPQFWIKDYVVCSPFQCLKVFQNAEFVITDTFHGTIFSAKYSEKFVVLLRESNRNKLADLVQRLNIEKHYVSSLIELDEKYCMVKDKEKTEKVINTETEKTITYLKNTLIKER